MKSEVYFSLILPCYNETQIFHESMPCIEVALQKIGKPFEIILVEDKSQDETQKLIQPYCEKKPFAKAIYHAENQGRGASVMDGIWLSKGKIVGFIDIDLEVSEQFILGAIAGIENGSDMVIGNRAFKTVSRA